VALGADRLRVRHQLLDALIPVVPLAFVPALARLAADAEVAEVGERSAARMIHALHDRREPRAVAREPAVVFDDHVDAVLIAELAQAAQAVRRERELLLVRPLALRVDADRVAPEEDRRLDPLVMVLDRLRAGGVVLR